MKTLLIYLAFFIFLIAGEVQCVVKMIRCNWEPVGKAEIIYTIGTFTGTGAFIGWLNIEDK
jgi:hypothetical protein